MVILDTDTLSLLERGDTPQQRCLRARLDPLPVEEKVTTIVSFEEQSRGWLKVIAKARSEVQIIEGYRRLHQHLENYRKMIVLDFDERAAVRFQEFRKNKVRVGPMDLRIASIALIHDAIVITRNLRDYRKVAGLKAEDWSTEVVH